MHSKKELDTRLRQSGIQPLKKLGQNFLVNPQICAKIVEAALAPGPASVVEIGPGLGALTDDLLEAGKPLTLVELDSGLVEYWRERSTQVNVIHKDALKLDWKILGLQKPSVLVSNLPYSIAASIVVEMSLHPIFDHMVLMFQKEVAERMAASRDDEDYGMLSVVAQTFWKISKVVDAGPQDFFPVPNVGSRVLEFSARSDLAGKFRADFVEFVKLAFSQRRKKLSSNLEKVYSSAAVKEALESVGFESNTRAQELNPGEFVQIFLALKKN